MELFATVIGVLLIGLVLWDAFETVILARRVARKLRLARFFYLGTWSAWASLGRLAKSTNSRENFLSIYGPLSLLALLTIWALTLVVGFALLHWGIGTTMVSEIGQPRFFTDLYFSGTTFFTLGLGDVHTTTRSGELLTIAEAGTGFAFLALLIAYIPGLSQAYSAREVNLSLLDARAGSPPSAYELLRRHNEADAGEELIQFLAEWERWCAQLLESHISFPVLAYFRSQHDNQSWVSALTAILDTSALLMACGQARANWRARLTYAMARHAVVDLCIVFELEPQRGGAERLQPDDLSILGTALTACGMGTSENPAFTKRLAELRSAYEPFCVALSNHLRMPLPQWVPRKGATDNWQAGQSDKKKVDSLYHQ
jgi:ion channel